MTCLLSAVYDNGVFRPLERVEDVPDHAIVRLVVELDDDQSNAFLDADVRIREMERLADVTMLGLTAPEDTALQAAHLDQRHFFDRPDA